MRIISRKTLREFWDKHDQSEGPLREWEALAEAADWRTIADVRRTFPHADAVKVNSGNSVIVFNIGGNNFRLLTAIKYSSRIVYTLKVLTHAEYDKGAWKKQL